MAIRKKGNSVFSFTKKLIQKIVLFLVLSLAFEELSLAKRKRDVAVSPSKREEGDFIIEKRSDGSTVKYKKKNKYDFEGANVEGLYKKPTGAYISNIKEVRGRTIIRIRENFDNEVEDSARLLK